MGGGGKGGGEELGLCPHPPGCWSTGMGEKAGFHLAKNAQRRRGSFPSLPQDFSRSCPKGGIFPPSVPASVPGPASSLERAGFARPSPAAAVAPRPEGWRWAGGPARRPGQAHSRRAKAQRCPPPCLPGNLCQAPEGPGPLLNIDFFLLLLFFFSRSLPPKSLQTRIRPSEKRQITPGGETILGLRSIRRRKAFRIRFTCGCAGCWCVSEHAALQLQSKPMPVPPLLPGRLSGLRFLDRKERERCLCLKTASGFHTHRNKQTFCIKIGGFVLGKKK